MQGYRELGAVAMGGCCAEHAGAVENLWNAPFVAESGGFGMGQCGNLCSTWNSLETSRSENDAGLRRGYRYGRVGSELWGKDRGCVAQKEKIVGCPGGDGMEKPRFRHGFDACGPDFSGEIEGSGYLAEKCGLFVLGFGKSYLN